VEAARKGEPLPEAEQRAIGEAIGKREWTRWMFCLALDTHADMAGLSTGPGTSFRPLGRVGDSPILGAGLYVDNEVGGCFSTGTGELNLLNASCYQVVENLRRGMRPREACQEACGRIVRTCRRNPHYRAAGGQINSAVVLYCLRKDGRYGAASMYRPYS
jgi:N4-(beta-N-acetylglucosaminyl)-L-asparaginase